MHNFIFHLTLEEKLYNTDNPSGPDIEGRGADILKKQKAMCTRSSHIDMNDSYEASLETDESENYKTINDIEEEFGIDLGIDLADNELRKILESPRWKEWINILYDSLKLVKEMPAYKEVFDYIPLIRLYHSEDSINNAHASSMDFSLSLNMCNSRSVAFNSIFREVALINS